MKILIAYYSRTGTTRQVAKELSGKMNADLLEIVDKKDRSGAIGWIVSGKDATLKNTTEIEDIKIKIEDYGLVVIGTPVRVGLMTPAIRTFIQQNIEKLGNVAIFTTQMGKGFQKYKEEFQEMFGDKLKYVDFFISKDIKNKNIEVKLDNFIKNIN